jgi:hypothetical protein
MYQKENKLSDEDVACLLTKTEAKSKGRMDLYAQHRVPFCRFIGWTFPEKPMPSIIDRLKRVIFHKHQTKRGWSEEELKRLKDLVEQFGQDWQKIGDLLERFPRSVKNRYRQMSMAAIKTVDDNERGMVRMWEDDESMTLLRVMLDLLRTDGRIDEVAKIKDVAVWIERPFQEWIKVETQYNQSPDILRSRPLDLIRLRWRTALLPELRRVVDNEPEDDLLMFSDLFEKMKRLPALRWTLEEDLTLIAK